MRYYVIAVLVIGMTCLGAVSVEALSSFHIGNSLTDQSLGLVQYAAGKGKTHTFKHVTIPGVGLEFHTGVQIAGSWDALVPQPFRNGADLGMNADVKYCSMYYDRALAGNGACRLYIFGQWPRMGEGEWDTQWNRPFIATAPGYAQPYESAVYPEELAKRMTQKYSNKPPCRVIPVGHVMDAFKKKMDAGQSIPELTNVWGLYADGVHLNEKGRYVQVATHYAVLYNDRPHNGPLNGLMMWNGPYGVSAQFAAAAWDIIWETVTKRTNITGVQAATVLTVARPVPRQLSSSNGSMIQCLSGFARLQDVVRFSLLGRQCDISLQVRDRNPGAGTYLMVNRDRKPILFSAGD